MKLSIITINFNNKDGLKRTIESVISQKFQEFEWIIIDGGSSDGSKLLIEEVARNNKKLVSYWCSEPDGGIYNAMNKGVKHSNGEYLQFLNSGDILYDNTIIGDFYELTFKEDIIAGDIIVDGSLDKARYNPEDEDLGYDYLMPSTIWHQSSFINRSLFEKFGGYDENLRIVSDWKFFLEMILKYDCTYKHWQRFVADFEPNGISFSEKTHDLLILERSKVLNECLIRVQDCIKKRDETIKNLDLPLGKILRKRIINKVKKFTSFFK